MKNSMVLAAACVVVSALFLFGAWALRVELEYRRNIRNGFPDRPQAMEYSSLPAVVSRVCLVPWKDPMIARLAYTYVGFLFLMQMLLFTASLLLHATVFIAGPQKIYAEYALMLFRAGVVVGIPVCAFLKDGLRWMDQIKSCPKWMWRAALAIGLYSLLTFFFPQNASLSESPLILSGFPLGFEATGLCVLYSVLWSGYLEKPVVVRRALHSIIIVAVVATVILAYRAGYLHHPKRYPGGQR
jgi:hypothetical protein